MVAGGQCSDGNIVGPAGVPPAYSRLDSGEAETAETRRSDGARLGM